MPTVLQQLAQTEPDPDAPLRGYANCLESLYHRYATRQAADGKDPVGFLCRYDDPADREVVALLAALLAYGRVGHILRSVGWVLDRLGPAPAERVGNARPEDLRKTLAGFRHRFQKTRHLAALLDGVGRVLRDDGSLEACFAAAAHPAQRTPLIPLAKLRRELDPAGACGHLLPDPATGSACKRLHLFLRWMVRRDDVDPGGWTCIGPARLLLPMDVHLHRWCRRLGATDRATADLAAAVQATAAFRQLRPNDPVRYDFALAHAGMDGPNDRP